MADVTPLTQARAVATIGIVARAVADGEAALSYSDLAKRLGMSRVNGQGLSSYLREAAAICAENGLPNVAAMVVSRESLDRGAPMPSDGNLSADLLEALGLTPADIPAEHARVRAFDWSTVDLEALGAA
jgi:hypothetical protein